MHFNTDLSFKPFPVGIKATVSVVTDFSLDYLPSVLLTYLQQNDDDRTCRLKLKVISAAVDEYYLWQWRINVHSNRQSHLINGTM